MSEVGSNVFHTWIQRFVTYAISRKNQSTAMYNTRHKATQRDKQTGKIVGLKRSENEKDTWETDSQKSAVQEIHTETSDGDISSDNEEANFLCNETIERHIDAKHRETSPSSVVRSQQCNSPMYKDTSQTKNRRSSK